MSPLITKLTTARQQHGLDAFVVHKGYEYSAPIWSLHRGAFHWLRTHPGKPATTYYEPKQS